MRDLERSRRPEAEREAGDASPSVESGDLWRQGGCRRLGQVLLGSVPGRGRSPSLPDALVVDLRKS